MMKCPICGSENVTPSHRRGLEKIMQFLFPRTPYRCKECWSRFWTGQFKGAALKVALVVAVLLFAIFYILPLDQLFKKNKDNQPVKTVSKSIEKPDKIKADKGDKPPVAAKSDNDDDDEGDHLKVAENAGDNGQPFKSEDLSEEAPVRPDKSAKPVKPLKEDKAASKPVKADKSAKEKAVKPAGQKKTDEMSDAEHEAAPEPPQVTKLKEPNVEVPRPGKTSAKAESKVKTVLPKTEVKAEEKEEVKAAENEEEKAVLPTKSPRRIKEIKATASENSVDITVSADGPVKDYKNFFLLKETPPKLVVDVKGKWKYLGKPAFDVDSGLVSKVRVAEHNEKGFFRIVMDLKIKEGMTPVFSEDSKGLTITVKK